MARRNDHTKEEIKEMVIEAGSKLIAQSGFSNFSTRKIAKKIGYTVGTLYNVFESYDDIIFHINAATIDDIKNFIEQNLNTNLKNSSSIIKQIACLYAEFADKNYNRWSALSEYNLPKELQLPEMCTKKVNELFAAIEQLLLGFIKNKSRAKKHAQIIWASVHGICILGLSKKLNVVGIDAIKDLINNMIDGYLVGIKKL